MYTVVYEKSFIKSLKKLDHPTRDRIIKWIKENLENCKDPRKNGKALTGQLKGTWRYRVGNYRLISIIEDDKLILVMVDVGHRSKIYS